MVDATTSASAPGLDYFISYTGVDRHYAEHIADWLEQAGYTILIQAWDFRPGHNFVTMMQRGALAKHTIAVLSPAYLEAKFCQQEWHAAISSDPTGENRKLIPVRIKHCNPDGLLKAAIYIDLVGLEMYQARAKFLDGLQPRGKPKTMPPFPYGGVGFASVSHSDVGGRTNA
jgi:hypothetical protein